MEEIKSSGNSYLTKNDGIVTEVLGDQEVLVKISDGPNLYAILEDDRITSLEKADGDESPTTVVKMDMETARKIADSKDTQKVIKTGYGNGEIEVERKTVGNKIKFGAAKAAGGVADAVNSVGEVGNDVYNGIVDSVGGIF